MKDQESVILHPDIKYLQNFWSNLYLAQLIRYTNIAIICTSTYFVHVNKKFEYRISISETDFDQTQKSVYLDCSTSNNF